MWSFTYHITTSSADDGHIITVSSAAWSVR